MWLKLVANKLLPNRSFGSQQFSSDKYQPSVDDEYSRESSSRSVQKGPDSQTMLAPFRSEKIAVDHFLTEDYKVFVSTWNVGGVPPRENLINLEEWLDTSNNLHDIYILGFQEVVPLSAGNVLGSENPNICLRWNSLIRSALNKKDEGSNGVSQHDHKERQKVYPVKEEDQTPFDRVKDVKRGRGGEFQCIVSKQMVGIMVSVWVRRSLRKLVRHTSVCCVGCGLMGCLGNKGSVSVRFILNDTSLCFVCSHLASGEKEGDESHRNWGASEIMSRTIFPAGPSMNLPRNILGHDRIIWLGDLNYRISLPGWETRSLIERQEWGTLHDRDQLRAELSEAGVFHGWKEGTIQFPPTYKYSPDSDKYYGWNESEIMENKRAPAWCDRILWYGEGIKQQQYERGESKLSDHRPVRATFTLSTDVLSGIKSMKSCFSSARFESLERGALFEYAGGEE